MCGTSVNVSRQLAMLLLADGDWRDTVLGGVNYGRDSDSIATMGGALAGALGGTKVVPTDLVEAVSTASRLDLFQPGRGLAAVALRIRGADCERHERSHRSFGRLCGD
jgi:ADP-ribosylglycohydrolase